MRKKKIRNKWLKGQGQGTVQLNQQKRELFKSSNPECVWLCFSFSLWVTLVVGYPELTDRTSHFLQFLPEDSSAPLAREKRSYILEPRQRSHLFVFTLDGTIQSGFQLTNLCLFCWEPDSTKETSYFWYIPPKEREASINLSEKLGAQLSSRWKKK